jgi:hypothetical protein
MEPRVLETRTRRPGVAPDAAHSVIARVAARMRAASLDRALAAGVDPQSSPALTARAGLLRTRRMREAVASAIYQTLKDASVGVRPTSVRVPPARGAVRRNRRELLELAAELRQASDVSARGVAATCVLLGDGTGPLYYEAEFGVLRAAIFRARSWL